MPALTLEDDELIIATQLAKAQTISIICLCAQWCNACREYKLVFDELAQRYTEFCFIWVDIETHADRLSEADIEVEDFPTILIEDAAGTRFFGTVLPHPQIIQRLLAHLSTLPLLTNAPKLRHFLT